jgi:tRNA threonylcarbamoyladenosine biosynthesis protein TsaB
MLLAIDTATRLMSIALHDGRDLLAEQGWRTDNRHTTELAPAIPALLAHCDVVVSDLTALAVSVGPGSYTGVRIGVALAKGLAAANSLPLVGISTLDTLAAGQPFLQSGAGLVAVVQAGRGRIIVKTYRWRKGHWSSHIEPRLMAWDALIASIDGPALITGEITAAGFEALEDAKRREVPVAIAPAAFRMRRAGFLAEAAWAQLNENEGGIGAFDAARVVPVYIKSEKS